MINTNTLEFSTEILNIITEIDEFKGAWKALSAIGPENLQSLRKVATIQSVGSSTRIEGSSLSDKDVASLLEDIQIKSFTTRDEQEVAGYAEVMQMVFEVYGEISVSENHMKQLHKDLLKYSEKDIRHRGEYKTVSNTVAAFDQSGKQIGVVFETATPFDTPRLMKELVEWVLLQIEEKELHPLIMIAIFIVVFLQIHPFQDGNGRLSRILTNLLLLRSGYTYTPYSSLESIVEQSKEAYYLALRTTQKTIRTDEPDWQPWLLYFLKSLRKQKKILEKKMEQQQILLTQLPELSLKILDYVKQKGRVTIREMVTITGKNRNTLKTHFRSLVKNGYLHLHGKGRGAWYGLVD